MTSYLLINTTKVVLLVIVRFEEKDFFFALTRQKIQLIPINPDNRGPMARRKISFNHPVMSEKCFRTELKINEARTIVRASFRITVSMPKDNRAEWLHLTTTNEMKPEDHFGSSLIICPPYTLCRKQGWHMWTNNTKSPFLEAYFELKEISVHNGHGNESRQKSQRPCIFI